jgi:hypothetical protein
MKGKERSWTKKISILKHESLLQKKNQEQYFLQDFMIFCKTEKIETYTSIKK